MQDRAHAEGGGADAEEAGSQAKGAEHAAAHSGKSCAHDDTVGITIYHWVEYIPKISWQPWPSNGGEIMYMLHSPEHWACMRRTDLMPVSEEGLWSRRWALRQLRLMTSTARPRLAAI